MFRPEIREVPEGCVVDLVADSVVDFQVGRIPIGTCDGVSEEDVSFTSGHSHPTGFRGEGLNDQILILLSPFAHPRVRMDDRADILDDVPLLPSFIVKGDSKSRQGL